VPVKKKETKEKTNKGGVTIGANIGENCKKRVTTGATNRKGGKHSKGFRGKGGSSLKPGDMKNGFSMGERLFQKPQGNGCKSAQKGGNRSPIGRNVLCRGG